MAEIPTGYLGGTNYGPKTAAQQLSEKASTPKRQQTLLRFPADLDTDGTGNIIRFNINLPEGSTYLSNGDYTPVKKKDGTNETSVHRREGNRAGIARRFSSNYVRTTTYIDLFMPPQVQSSYISDWNSENLGVLGSLIDGAYGLSDTNTWADAENSWRVVKNTLKEAGIRTLSSTADALTPINFDAARAAATSTIANPYMEVLFNGVHNRTFSFTFKMIPRNEFEQRSIKAIVDEFKFHWAPEMKYGGQTNYLIFPSEFDITFLRRNSLANPWLFKISTCALTNFTVNHSPEGQYASHADGAPFATEITLEFTELEVLTKKRIREGF